MSNRIYYHADEATRRLRVKALRKAQKLFGNGPSDDPRTDVGIIMKMGVFSWRQLGRWSGLSPWKVRNVAHRLGLDEAPGWGIHALHLEQIPTAIELAKAGVLRERPKALIYSAVKQEGFSPFMVSGLVGIHKENVLRLVERFEAMEER